MPEPTEPKEIYQSRSEAGNLDNPASIEEQNPNSIIPEQLNTSTFETEVSHDAIEKDGGDISSLAGLSSKEERTGQDSNDLMAQETTSTSAEPPISIYSLTQRKLLVWVIALAGFIVSALNLTTSI